MPLGAEEEEREGKGSGVLLGRRVCARTCVLRGFKGWEFRRGSQKNA